MSRGCFVVLGPGERAPIAKAASIEPLPREIPIGIEQVALLDSELLISVDPDLGVRVRIYAADRKTLRADIVTTAQKALYIAGLFKLAAERADPSLRVVQLEGPAA